MEEKEEEEEEEDEERRPGHFLTKKNKAEPTEGSKLEGEAVTQRRLS